MPQDLSEYRARAKAHQDELDRDTRYLTVQELATRWHISEGLVRAIPITELPWKPFGRGLKLTRRRYHPDDVLAYENRDRSDERAAS